MQHLKFDLSRPLTFLVMAMKLVRRQGSCMKPSSTNNAPIAKNLQQRWCVPQTTEITVNKHVDQQLKMIDGRAQAAVLSDISLSELPGYQDVLLTGVKDHGCLSDQIANMCAADIMGAWVASASDTGNQCLQKEPDHFVGLIPEIPMALLEVSTEIV